MTNNDREALFAKMKACHDDVVARLREEYMGKEVTLVLGWPKDAKGRAALIDGIIIDDGVPLFLCMVTRSGTEPTDRDFLNSHSWTRSYRPWEQFIVLDEQL